MKQPALFETETDARVQISGSPFVLEAFWAMEPGAFARLREALSTCSPERLAAVTSSPAAEKQDPGYEMHGGVALMRFEGYVTKRKSPWARMGSGIAATIETAAAFKAATADPAVKSILLVVDSPGGTVDGTAELADTIYETRATKPVVVYADGTMASAAYWIGAQGNTLVGGPTTAVGSIGVFSVLPDFSRLAKNIGIEVNVVRSAAGKGAGTMGTQITDAQLADIQRHVDELHQHFVSMVARGRGMPLERAAALADGRLQVGKGAVAAGLLDRIAPLATVLTEMQAAAAAADENKPQGALGAGVVHTHATGGSNPSPATTMRNRAEEPENDTRAELEGQLTAQQEDTMAENTPSASVTPAQLAELTKALASTNERLETLSKENADLKAKLEGVSGNVVAITTEREITALIDQARADVKLTKGNEAIVEPMLRAMAAIDLGKAKAYVENSMKPLAKGEGTVVTGAASATVAAPRHRFDAFGAEVWGASSDPKMQEFGRKISWIAAQEAAGRKFRSSAEAFSAFNAAHASRAAA